MSSGGRGRGRMVAQALNITEDEAGALMERARDGDERAQEQLQEVRRQFHGEQVVQ